MIYRTSFATVTAMAAPRDLTHNTGCGENYIQGDQSVFFATAPKWGGEVYPDPDMLSK